jgi:hypothetical protein
MSRSYLIQYGKPGFVGRFRSAGEFARGDRVVLAGPRGTELGTVLCEPADRFASVPEDGDLLRPAAPGDEPADRGAELLAGVQAAADARGLPLTFVDVEHLCDGTAILHGLPWDECDATPLFEELSDRFGIPVRLLDLSRSPTPSPEPTAGGCGKPGCGSEAGGCSSGSCGTGGGCSSGSCSRGGVKSAGELTAYFADLRKKMEASARTPLC